MIQVQGVPNRPLGGSSDAEGGRFQDPSLSPFIPIIIVVLALRFYFYVFLERGEERKKERERNIDVPEKHRLVASRTSPIRQPRHVP